MSPIHMSPIHPDRHQPLYARVLRLDHLRPGGLLCFLLFEGAIVLAVLLSLAELVNWWSVIVLPLVVAGLVKVNDFVAGIFARARRVAYPPVRGVVRVVGTATAPMPALPASGTPVIVVNDPQTPSTGQWRPGRGRVTNERGIVPVRTGPSEPPEPGW